MASFAERMGLREARTLIQNNNLDEETRIGPLSPAPSTWNVHPVMTAKNERYSPFDPADYLDDLHDVADYLQIAINESSRDATAVPRALGVIARSGNMSELARVVGMSRDGLYKALSENGNPTWATILKVTTALGLRLELHAAA